MKKPASLREQIKQAQALIAAGDLKRARTLLQTIDHPKAQAMLAGVESQLAAQPTGGFPLGRVLALVGMVLVLGVGGLLVMTNGSETTAAPVLPTLAVYPTSDCTQTMVATWWGVQNIALDTFAQDASSASRTMPGQRLNERVGALRQFRADFPGPPDCASIEVQAGVTDLTVAMDATISILEDWAAGDPERVTMELPLAQDALRDARTRIRLGL
jgi:hypothetical protein